MDAPEDHTTRSLEEALDGHRFAMVATVHGAAVSSRPLTLLEQDGPTIRFLVSKSAPWAGDVADRPQVSAAFAAPDRNNYVSLSGSATLSTDRTLIERLWNPAAGVYFDGKDDPDIAVLEIEVDGGEFWEGPSSKVGQVLDMARIKLTGNSADEHGEVLAP